LLADGDGFGVFVSIEGKVRRAVFIGPENGVGFKDELLEVVDGVFGSDADGGVARVPTGCDLADEEDGAVYVFGVLEDAQRDEVIFCETRIVVDLVGEFEFSGFHVFFVLREGFDPTITDDFPFAYVIGLRRDRNIGKIELELRIHD